MEEKYLVTGSTVIDSDEYDICEGEYTLKAAQNLAKKWLTELFNRGEVHPILYTKIFKQHQRGKTELIHEYRA